MWVPPRLISLLLSPLGRDWEHVVNHRLPKLKVRGLCDSLCVERIGWENRRSLKKKNWVNNYLISNKVFLPQMCRELVSCADFKAILTPFSGII